MERKDKRARRLRIGFNLLFAPPGYVGGTVKYAREILAALAARGEWEIIAYVRKGALRFDIAVPNVRRHEVALGSGLLLRGLYEHLILPFVAKRHGVQLLYSPGFVGPLFGRFKKVITIHDFYYKRFPRFVRLAQRIYWSLMIPLCGRLSDAITVVSDTTRNDLLQYYPALAEKTRRLYPGSPARMDPTQTTQAAPYVLFVGYVTPNKNIEVLLEAAEILARRDVKCSVVIAGRDLYGIVNRWFRREVRHAHIQIREGVSDGELAGLYRSATCAVVPSVYEGFGLPALEAMAYGCPVLVTGGGALGEVVKDCGYYFGADRPADLAMLIEELMDDPAARQARIHKGYARATEFSWTRSAMELSILFRAVLADRAIQGV